MTDFHVDIKDLQPDMAALVEDLPYPIWLLRGEKGDIVWVNQEAERWLRRSVRFQQSRELPDVLILPQEVRDGYNRCLDAQSSVIIRNTQMELSEGDTALCHLTMFPSGDYIGLMLQVAAYQSDDTLTNVDAMSAMGRMLAHEIKNPLAGMSGAVQLLKPDVKGEEPLSLLNLIGGEIERIKRLVDRMETLGDNDPERAADVNIHEVLHRAAQIMSTEKGRTIQFTEHYDPSLPSIIADEDTLMQALLNLIKNAVEAIEHSGQGGEIILKTLFRSGVRRRIEGGAVASSLPIEIQIIDDGPGIPKPIRTQIFQPFVSNKPTGQGLGLAVVAKIIKAHNGIVELSSQPGKTKFSILLPLSDEAA